MANKKQKSIIKINPHPHVVEQLKTQLVKNGGLKITGFGVFDLKRMKAHTNFNPGANKFEKFPAYVKINFLPTKSLKQAIQKWK